MKQSLSYVKDPSGIPKRVMAQHKYFTTGVVASSAAASAVSYSFRLRSMFDPDLTASGHQPRGRDQFVSAGYGYYKVHSAKVSISMAPNAASISAYNSNTFAIALSGASSPFVDSTTLAELGTSSSGTVLKRKHILAQVNTSAPNFKVNNVRCNKYISNLWGKAKRFNFSTIGPTMVEYFDHNSYTAVGSNPDTNTEVFLDLISAAGDGDITSQGFEFQITITYYTEWVWVGEPSES